MKFVSTRSPGKYVTFQEAVFQGLAPDGGLYVPASNLDLKSAFLKLNSKSSFVDCAATIAMPLLKDDLSPEAIQRVLERAFPFSPILRGLTNEISILELFHGPSAAFKDFGASFLASVMEEFLKDSGQRAVILTATSGDTGSAVATAFHNRKNIDVVILYPSGRVSPLQEKQLTTLGGNVIALEVKGSFDDCQRMVKEAFTNSKLQKLLPLTSANSISLGRLIPQSFYYVWAFAQLRETLHDELIYCVPSGNFGNLTAGIYSWKWGLPITSFVAATNSNDVVPEYLESGVYKPRPSVLTYSNAMDVGTPSNFERLEYLFQKSVHQIRTLVQGDRVGDADTLATMKRIHDTYEYDLCPHTAVGYLAAERLLKGPMNGSGHVIVLGTAHPGKFLEVVEKATGRIPELPASLRNLMDKEKKSTVIENTLEDLSAFLIKNLV